MKHHARCLKDRSPANLHFETNNLKSNETAEDIATDIMNLAISVKKENKFNDKGRNINSLLKREGKKEKIVFVDNLNITVSILNYSDYC